MTRGTAPAPGPPPAKHMVWVPGGTFLMGSDFADYPEEGPPHLVSVAGFWMDAHPVTVAEFRRFVQSTHYRTVAERPLDPAYYPGADPRLLVSGSLVFQPTRGPVDLTNMHNWWRYVPGANWRAPAGPGVRSGSGAGSTERHPVVHVCWDDVAAYATWVGKTIATEAEWEFAARGGLEGATYCWGDEFAPRGRMMANTWQGEFPWQNLKLDGYVGTSPIGSFPPNGYGLYDMAGNVWEWTADYHTPSHGEAAEHGCCVPHNPRTLSPDGSYDVQAIGGAHIPRRVIKGGSHLCAPNYCLRYRPAARQPQMVETGMAHLGFRCIVRV
jgi:sulfatase modifying factor 1